MSRPKTSTPPLYTVNRLSELTGSDRRTLRKILRDTPPDSVDGGLAKYSLDTLQAATNRASQRAARHVPQAPQTPAAELRGLLFEAYAEITRCFMAAQTLQQKLNAVADQWIEFDDSKHFTELEVPLSEHSAKWMLAFKNIPTLAKCICAIRDDLEECDRAMKFLPDQCLKIPRDQDTHCEK